MVTRSSVHAEEAIPAEPSTDLEVNGSHWDRTRTRLMHQASRRVIRGRNAEDQALIMALQNQVDHEHLRAEGLSEELARFHAGEHDMHNMQNAHRVNRVKHIANLRQSITALQQRIRELGALTDRQEQTMQGMREDNQTAQLLIAHYKAEEDEAAEMERRGTSRLMRDRQRIEEEIEALTQDNEGLRVREEPRRSGERGPASGGGSRCSGGNFHPAERTT